MLYPAFLAVAESTGGADINSALTTAFTGVVSDITSGITSVLPIALGLVGTVMVIMFGIKIFKKITNKANG